MKSIIPVAFGQFTDRGRNTAVKSSLRSTASMESTAKSGALLRIPVPSEPCRSTQEHGV